MAYDHGELDLQAAIRVRTDGELVPTTVGRVLLYEIVPKQLPFKIVNRAMGKKQLGDLIEQYLKKGHQAYIEGHLRLDQWNDKTDGSKRSKLKLVVDVAKKVWGSAA